MSRRVAARDNSRYGAAATAAPVLTASARSRRRRVKVFSQVFFKKLARCGAELHGPKGVARTVGPAFPYFQKRGDRRPPLGVAQSPGVLLEEGAGRVAQRPLPGLSPVGRVRPVRCIFPPAAPVKAVELCSTPRKLLKKFDQNFSLSLPHPSAAPYTMRNKGWLNSTTWPLPTQISATVPSTSAGISFISFMASMMHRVSPFFTWSPTSTKGRASGPGAE